MTDFGIEFEWCGYVHRADVSDVCGGDEAFTLSKLEYLYPLLPDERAKHGDKKHLWVDVEYLLDTSAAPSIYNAAENSVWAAFDEYVSESYDEPEDYE